MKRRIFSFMMVTVMCFSLLQLTIFAAESTISLNKTTYAGGEKIVIEVSGITQEMVDAQAFVAIYEAGAPHDAWGEWFYTELGDSQGELMAPLENGSYEMRLYDKDHDYTAASLVMKVDFQVGDVTVANPGKIALDKTAYLANELITVQVSEITAKMEADEAFIAIYKKDAKHNEWGEYDYVKEGSSTLTLKAPNLNGNFEIRLYTENHFYSDATFVMSVPFTLSGAVVPSSSSWASTEIEAAEALGLIPESLKTADLTRPITREEFAELAVKLYEKSTGTEATPSSPNPFTDTKNPEILKALAVGITSGTSATTFSPLSLITREQCATMLFRDIKAIYPEGDYSIAGIPDFPDQKDISAYAVEATKYMAKLEIIKGDSKGNFIPKAITPAQIAAGYGMATREAAILMTVRTYNKIN